MCYKQCYNKRIFHLCPLDDIYLSNLHNSSDNLVGGEFLASCVIILPYKFKLTKKACQQHLNHV